MKILLIDNYDSFTYNLYQCLKKSGAENIDVRRNDAFDSNFPDNYTHILISPGPGIPVEAGLTLQVIKKFAGKKSILGICLGHQAIAEAFGGKLLNSGEVVHGKASMTKNCELDNPLFQNLPTEIQTGRYHSWMVDPGNFLDELRVTAIGEKGGIMGLMHRKHPIFGLQFHPESVLTPSGQQIIQNWLELT